ncbi:MAG: hypothetical protein AAB547_00965 [Patescibacteria group bacterium]
MEEKTKATKQNGITRKIPYGLIGRVFLGSIAAVGMVSLAVAAPNAIQIAKLFQGRRQSYFRRYQAPSYVRKTLKSLHRRGMVRISERQGEAKVYLTDKGRRELLKYKLLEKRLEKRHWDKKWHIIIFDIEEKRRSARNCIRKDMQSFGFAKLQESVWVYPYECEEAITLLKTQYKMGKELVYIVAGDIENDGWLRKKFKLEN